MSFCASARDTGETPEMSSRTVTLVVGKYYASNERIYGANVKGEKKSHPREKGTINDGCIITADYHSTHDHMLLGHTYIKHGSSTC